MSFRFFFKAGTHIPRWIERLFEGLFLCQRLRTATVPSVTRGYFWRMNSPMKYISATNRSFPGFMGHKGSQVFFASPVGKAASAITGKITDPPELLS